MSGLLQYPDSWVIAPPSLQDLAMKYRACVKFIMAGLVLMIGCDQKDKTTQSDITTSKSYNLKGIVRKIDPKTGEVTISHEEIVGFMPKMTMPFLLKKKGMLEGIKIDDQVEGTLKVDSKGKDVQGFELTDLKVVGHVSKLDEIDATAVSSTIEVLKPGEVVPDFSMTTQDGKPLKLADLRGKVVVLSFIYTRCPSPEFCPAMDAKFAELARRIGANAERAGQIRLLSVSFDPEHDTPEVLKVHAARRGARPPLWTFAVASHEELSKVIGSLGLTYIPGTREIDHNLRAAVIGPDGRLGLLEMGQGWSPVELLKTVYKLIPDVEK
jgi:protein SCO1/2